MREKIGIVQVRGVGDAIIALPIAEYYHKRGADVYFALDDRFCPSFQEAAPYCNFVPVPFSKFDPKQGLSSPYWYELPRDLLIQAGCSNIISFPYHESHFIETAKDDIARQFLSTRLSGPYESRITSLKMYKHLKFDEYKYATAKVPFEFKWKLNLRRNRGREIDLLNKMIEKNGKPTIVAHLEGSDVKLNASSLSINKDVVNLIVVDPTATDNLFDWLGVLEHADQIICIDSVFANIVEQLNMPNTKHFIRRSSINMTPVLKNNWDYVGVDLRD